MNTWRNASLAVTAAALLALTTACGQDKGTESPNGQNVGNASPAGQAGSGYDTDSGYGSDTGYGSDSGAQSAKSKQAGQLAVWDSKKLGKVLTDSEGFTLYRFDKDTASPPKSNCEGDCAKIWPVVPAGNVTAAAGTDDALIGKVTRADGTQQLTIAGWPMYRYAKDAKPGDANGQGVGGTWFASAPDGKKAAVNADGPVGGEQADLAGLSVRKDPKLGNIVVDKRGMTVYRFKKDSAWPMKSACTGACLSKWPVVAPLAKNDVSGVTTKGFVTFNRPDGLKQQSIDCWPIYTFSGDTKPGDTNGQGVGGTWYAVSPDAKLVGASK
ncbi:SCO0930 family lipoprotein [Streptomyces sp. NPDC002917]|uniref:SCO0930 family lipoprotein n=1 Tax=unclassified Streptomyces TaxID=2593676 RepID=UPI002DD90069|nr:MULTISPECIES: SCO0930 family lipoprotein [unclassified Streptomyces]WSF83091.1 SCO0930 family lipoprotein [Streptomyces sp. NBC_01744]WTC78136.1 SCO0930 family lipoprotein [Streptomyces sp. NBC_01653]WTD37319.1 SCO0930 family lipoprotein [Streptomyces sp. NBC_01643]WTD92726.1 SCO0930 family lipoprotein [Streptomyces sp. NBC_01637]WSC40650.1 SCO0930 family lipoprotein [Streptomyces sp. NBC_01763]